jgi:predicted dinucleotide-binding enzyme
MNIGVFGTGTVGRTIAGKLHDLGHAVMMGTRDVAVARERAAGPRDSESFAEWEARHPKAEAGSLAEAAAHGEILFNCTAGHASLDALTAAGTDNLAGKILVDVANPLEFPGGVLSLIVCNTDSLAEQIQRAFPETKVIKSLNTVTARVMVEPGELGQGDHHVFLCGDDAGARQRVEEILREWFGWRQVIDLGDLTGARGMEMYLPLWVRLMSVQETPAFNVKVVRQG